MTSYLSPGGIFLPVQPSLQVDQNGNPVAGGSTGIDRSINAPTIPSVGADFGNVAPYNNYHLVKTIAANPLRQYIDVENTSGAQIVLLRDDGAAANGQLPTNASIIPLAGGSGVGSQGGSWSSTTFKGRLQIYGPPSTTPQITAFED